MSRKAELPIAAPLYATYQCQIPGTAITTPNPSIRNYYYNRVTKLTCTRRFLREGFTSPELNVLDSGWVVNPHIERLSYNMRYLSSFVHRLIRDLIDEGYYIYFNGVDDYYVKGKSWYHERHFEHDGMICGYDEERKTYSIYSYDSKWICRRFETPVSAFARGMNAALENGCDGMIYGVRAGSDEVAFSPKRALRGIREYLDSDMKSQPFDGKEYFAEGIVVQTYMRRYLDMLLDGSIPYERKDRRIFRLIWEHKNVMRDRIGMIEAALGMKGKYAEEYALLTAQAEKMRMIYASYSKRRRDDLLAELICGLEKLENDERRILSRFAAAAERKIEV